MRVMHNMTSDLRPSPSYRERLTPSLWVLVSAAVTAPMAALVFVPIDPTVALVTGILVGFAVVAGLIAIAPVIAVDDGELRVGRAHVSVHLLGDPVALVGEEARHVRGPGLSRSAWHMLRPGVDGVVRVPLHDPRDPTTEWVFSTRTPDRVAAVLRRARADVAAKSKAQATSGEVA